MRVTLELNLSRAVTLNAAQQLPCSPASCYAVLPHTHPPQVEGLKGADHSPSVLLLDEAHERLSEMQQSMPSKQTADIKQGLQQLGRDEDNLPNSSDSQGQPDRIKYS